MTEGWKCPNCGKAHGPHIDTCPGVGGLPIPFGSPSKRPSADDAMDWTKGNYKQVLDYLRTGTWVIDPLSGRDLGPAD